MAEWDVESHEVDTLRERIAKLKVEVEQLLGQLLVAEQQRDAAHAALKEIAEEMRQAIAIAKPAGGNVSIIYLANWQARLLDAALAASAPQKKGTK